MGHIRAQRHRLRLLKAQEPVLPNPHPDEVQGWSSCENLHTIVDPFKRGLKPKVLAKIKKRETYKRGSRELAKVPKERVSLYPKKAKPQAIIEGFSQLNISDWKDDDFKMEEADPTVDVSAWTDADFDEIKTQKVEVSNSTDTDFNESMTQNVDVSTWSDFDFTQNIGVDVSTWRDEVFDTYEDVDVSNWTNTDLQTQSRLEAEIEE